MTTLWAVHPSTDDEDNLLAANLDLILFSRWLLEWRERMEPLFTENSDCLLAVPGLEPDMYYARELPEEAFESFCSGDDYVDVDPDILFDLCTVDLDYCMAVVGSDGVFWEVRPKHCQYHLSTELVSWQEIMEALGPDLEKGRCLRCGSRMKERPLLTSVDLVCDASFCPDKES